MEDEELNLMMLLNCGAFMTIIESGKTKLRRRRPYHWVSPYLKARNEKGRFFTDFKNLRNDPTRFIENFRMPPSVFDELWEILEPHLLPKRNTRPNDFIPTKAKLAIVLEYLASGDIQRHIASCYRISKQHFGRIVSDVCKGICSVLKNEIPDWTEHSLLEISNCFRTQWNFPNCVGAIDGKHIAIKAPPKSGSIFYNYKGFHSIVLMATCDANYKFTYVDVGAYGSEGDSNIMKNSRFGISILNDSCQFRADGFIDGKKVPYFIVGDDAFPLCKRIIKPYNSKHLSKEEQIFNNRLSRARRCIENAFGILSAKWLCLRKVLFCHPDRARSIVSACCLLHNFLINKCGQTYNPPIFSGFEGIDGFWESGEWETIQQQEGPLNDLGTYRGRASDYRKYVRNVLKDYVNSTSGSVPWQNNATFL